MALHLITIHSTSSDTLVLLQNTNGGMEYRYHPGNGRGHHVSVVTGARILGRLLDSPTYVRTELTRRQLIQLKNIIQLL